MNTTKQKINKTKKKWPLYALGGVLIIILFVPLIGLIKDALGVHCTGFFGVQSSCLENSFTSLSILAVNPIIVLLTIVLIVSLVVAGRRTK